MNLDDASAVRAADGGRVLASIEGMRRQCASALGAARALAIPDAFVRPDQILVVGMGGSALAADIARALFAPTLRVPFLVVRGGPLPGWVGPQTLVVLSSYSGETEEVLAAADEAFTRTGRAVAITTGGSLAARAAARGRPVLALDPSTNPSGQPRFAVGGSLFALLGILERVGALGGADSGADSGAGLGARAGADRAHSIGALDGALAEIDASHARHGVAARRPANRAKEIALFLEGRAVAVVAAEHLAGAARALANQLNETAKTFAAPFELPELNHHLMEGLLLPRSNPDSLAFLLVESPRYSPRIRARFAATREVVASQKIPDETFVPAGGSPLSEALDALAFGSYLALYLALRGGQDPAAIPWVDHFKARLAGLAGP